MKHLRIAVAVSLIGLMLSGCAAVRENTLLEPTRSRPDLGLRLRVTPVDTVPEAMRGDRSQILRVVQVKPGRSAEQAGIQTGDILLSIDDQPVSGVDDSVGAMQVHRWGDSVTLTIVRDGRMQRVPVVLEP